MARVRRLRERGAAAVEMAIILPVLVLMIGGIIDFGRFFMVNAILTNAASEGTRYAVVSPDLTKATEVAKVKARAEAAAKTATGVASASTDAAATFNACSAGQMSVDVTLQFKWLLINAVPGISNPKTLKSTSVIGC